MSEDEKLEWLKRTQQGLVIRGAFVYVLTTIIPHAVHIGDEVVALPTPTPHVRHDHQDGPPGLPMQMTRPPADVTSSAITVSTIGNWSGRW